MAPKSGSSMGANRRGLLKKKYFRGFPIKRALLGYWTEKNLMMGENGKRRLSGKTRSGAAARGGVSMGRGRISITI